MIVAKIRSQAWLAYILFNREIDVLGKSKILVFHVVFVTLY